MTNPEYEELSITFVIEDWKKILHLLKKHGGIERRIVNVIENQLKTE